MEYKILDISGPVFAGLTLHAWIALVAFLVGAAIIFILIRFARGSELVKPIILLSLAGLADVLMGALLSLEKNLAYMWLVLATVNFIILLTLIWVAQISGVFVLIKSKLKRKNGEKNKDFSG